MPSDVPPSKRHRVSKKRVIIDRLSTLPESVIVHILSFLPILHSVRTGILSRRWQYLWACVPSIFFNYDDRYNSSEVVTSDLVEFVEAVNKTLVLCDGCSVKSFGVKFPYRKQFASNANLWARFASRNGVDKFELKFNLPENGNDNDNEDHIYAIPQFLYTDSKFRELHFSRCRIEPKKTVTWNSLKKLSIGYVDLSDDAIQLMLAGTPVLEMLELYNFKGIRNLHIGKSGVKRLVLRDPCTYGYGVEEDLYPLEISAPNVQSLEISGTLVGCQLVDIKSLVEAKLFDFYLGLEHEEDDVLVNLARGFLDSLAHVKTLTLGTWGIAGLALLHTKRMSPRLLRCECLTIDTELWRLTPLGIAALLRYYPLLQTLMFTISPEEFANQWSRMAWYDVSSLCIIEKEFSDSPIPFSGFASLKTVKFFGFRDDDSPDFQFVEILLKNSRMLQKMIIHMETRKPDDLLKAAQKLLSFQRSFPNAELLMY